MRSRGSGWPVEKNVVVAGRSWRGSRPPQPAGIDRGSSSGGANRTALSSAGTPWAITAEWSFGNRLFFYPKLVTCGIFNGRGVAAPRKKPGAARRTSLRCELPLRPLLRVGEPHYLCGHNDREWPRSSLCGDRCAGSHLPLTLLVALTRRSASPNSEHPPPTCRSSF